MRIVNLTIGFAILLLAVSLIGPRIGEPPQKEPDKIQAHDHKKYPRCIGNGIKCGPVKTCGDTVTVDAYGNHNDTIPNYLRPYIKKPE